MKVAFVLGTTAGGTGRHVQMLAAGCAARGLQAEVFAPGETRRAFPLSSLTGPARVTDGPCCDSAS